MIQSYERFDEFIAELKQSFAGEMRLDKLTKLLYSTDASIYRMEPLGVLFPRGHDDVAAAVALAARHGIPLLSRGAGTSLAGQTVAEAVILDYTPHMNRILEVRPEERRARVELWVVLDQLNGHLKKSGWQFGPDVATSNRATIGGMAGNNSCGARSVLYGKMVDHLREARVVFSNTGEYRLGPMRPEDWRTRVTRNTIEGRLYRTVDRILQDNADEIRRRYPSVMRHVGGYNLNTLLADGNRNLTQLLVGSEGTLGACTELTVGIVPAPKHKAIAVLHFDDIVAAMDAVPSILEMRPAAIELLDRMIV